MHDEVGQVKELKELPGLFSDEAAVARLLSSHRQGTNYKETNDATESNFLSYILANKKRVAVTDDYDAANSSTKTFNSSAFRDGSNLCANVFMANLEPNICHLCANRHWSYANDGTAYVCSDISRWI